jgi:hypothetical protein
VLLTYIERLEASPLIASQNSQITSDVVLRGTASRHEEVQAGVQQEFDLEAGLAAETRTTALASRGDGKTRQPTTTSFPSRAPSTLQCCVCRSTLMIAV